MDEIIKEIINLYNKEVGILKVRHWANKTSLSQDDDFIIIKDGIVKKVFSDYIDQNDINEIPNEYIADLLVSHIQNPKKSQSIQSILNENIFSWNIWTKKWDFEINFNNDKKNKKNKELKWKYTINLWQQTELKIIYDNSLESDIENWEFYFEWKEWIFSKENILVIKNSSSKNISFHEISIKNIQNFQKIQLIWITAHTIKIENYYWENTIFEISDSKITNLEIKHSDLWIWVFNWVKIWKFTLKNVLLKNCIFNWCSFPSNLEDIWDDKKQKDNYRQLKFVMDMNWNHTEANKFYAKEMEYYGKTLDISNILYSRILNLNWWIFFLQKLISNFWNSWIRPILWIFIFANLAIAYESNFTIYWLLDFQRVDWRLYWIDLVRYLTPFTELARWEDITFFKFIYNLLIIFLVYHFTIAIKRTTRR